MANSSAVRESLSLLVPTTGIPQEILSKVESARRNEVISDSYPYPTKLSSRKYERQKAELQVELLKMQRWVQETEERVVLPFEGRDAAGKGGTIKRFMEHLNPRGTTLVALPAPSEREHGQWYFQRYVQHLPAKGESVFFDRSWYNRAVVEPVMGFCTPAETVRFLMFAATDTKGSPWVVVKSDDKRRARINCMRYVLRSLEYDPAVAERVSKPNAKLIGPAKSVYAKGEVW